MKKIISVLSAALLLLASCEVEYQGPHVYHHPMGWEHRHHPDHHEVYNHGYHHDEHGGEIDVHVH